MPKRSRNNSAELSGSKDNITDNASNTKSSSVGRPEVPPPSNGGSSSSANSSSSSTLQGLVTNSTKLKRHRPHHGNIHKGTFRAKEGEYLPQKRYFRQRAHINPLGSMGQHYTYPIAPERMNWDLHYPLYANNNNNNNNNNTEDIASTTSTAIVHPILANGGLQNGKQVEIADVGCGFGGLIVGLSPVFSSQLMLGLEIRNKVTEYVRLRILALRRQGLQTPSMVSSTLSSSDTGLSDHTALSLFQDSAIDTNMGTTTTGKYDNLSVIKTNAMKYLPNFFKKYQLNKIFFCFPDPQFKPSHHRRRIVTTALLAEYAFALRPGGRLYTITDVLDLHNWMRSHSECHELFERLTPEEEENDPCVRIMREATEEGKKVARNGGSKYVAVFRRLTDDEGIQKYQKQQKNNFWYEPKPDYTYIPAPSQQIHLLRNPKSQETKKSK